MGKVHGVNEGEFFRAIGSLLLSTAQNVNDDISVQIGGVRVDAVVSMPGELHPVLSPEDMQKRIDRCNKAFFRDTSFRLCFDYVKGDDGTRWFAFLVKRISEVEDGVQITGVTEG